MKKTVLVLIVMLFSIACSSLKVTSDFNKDTDFTKYNTFKVLYFVNDKDYEEKSFSINDINKKRIEKAVSNEASLKGLEFNDNPDVIFLYAIDIDMKKSYESHTTYTGGSYMGYGGRRYGRYGYRGASYGMGSSHTTTYEVDKKVGKLRIAMIDAKTQELIWMGTAVDEVKGDVEHADENIKEVISKIMYKLPIKK